jgi:peptidoglycan/LPS O-acetylase OafA/YrhL
MNQDRYNNFSLIRLFAATQVVFTHTYHWLNIPINPSLKYFSKLFPGVAIFFVISGFLITKSYIENRGNLKAFFISRALRIYPALWFNLFLIVILLSMTGAGKLSDITAFHYSPFHLILFSTGQMWGTIFAGLPFKWTGFYKFFPNDVLWTIAVELGFYILIPFILYYAKENIRRKLYLSILILFLISFFFAILNSKWLITIFPDHNIYAYISQV